MLTCKHHTQEGWFDILIEVYALLHNGSPFAALELLEQREGFNKAVLNEYAKYPGVSK